MRRDIAAGLLTGSCATWLLLGLPPAAFGQEVAAESRLDEIVVSARKKNENVIDVPIAIDTVTSSQIEALDLQSLAEIAKFTPGMYYTDFNASGTPRQDRLARSFVVRGLSLNNSNNLSDSAILFVDGAPVKSGNLPGVTDIERVEVLKGPQAAYFGRNTFAGAISVTTREPSDTWQARATAEGSSYNSSDLALSVEGPLIPEKLLVRVSAEAMRKGGEYYNWLDSNERLGDQATNSVAVTVKFMPIDKLTIRANFNYFVYDDGPGAQARFIDNSLNCDPGHTGHNTWYCGVAPRVQPNQIQYDFALTPQWRQDSESHSQYGGDGIDNHAGLQSYNYHGTLKIDYELPWGIQFESITAEDVTRAATITDEWYDPNFVNPYFGIIPGVSKSWNWLYLVEVSTQDFSEEIRFTSAQDRRLRWTVGANYLSIPKVEGGVYGDVPLGNPLALPALPVFSKTYAGFGGLYYDILANLELGAEARYQSDKPGSYFKVNGQVAQIATTFNSFAPRFTLKYKPTPDTSIYAQYARGTLPGTFNSSLLLGAGTATAAQIAAAEQATGASLNVKEETLDTEEIGIKSSFLDGRAFATFDVYAGKVKNEQVAQNFAVVVPGVNTPYVGSALVNQGSIDIDGVEGQITLQVTRELQVSAAFAYNNTKITSGADTTVAVYRGCNAALPACTNVNGNHLPFAPETQGDVDVSYTRPLNDRIKWFAGADYIYVGTKYADTANLLQTGSQQLVNFHLGLTTDTWKLEGWGKNVFNNQTPELVGTAFDYNTFKSNAYEIPLPQKATYGIRATYKFH